MSSRVLVTGAGGFIGSRLLDRFLKRETFDGEVLGVVDSARFAWHLVDIDLDRSPRVRVERADQFDSDAMRELLGRFKPDTLIHLAAVGVDPSAADSPLNLPLNHEFTLRLLDDFIGSGGKRFVFAGSCFEYGQVSGGSCVTEGQICVPVTVYGRSKLMATEGILGRVQTSGIEAVILRPFHTYGPAENPNRIVPYLIRAARQGRVASLTKGEQVRDFVYVADVADAFIAATLQPLPHPGKIYNVSTGRATSLREFARALDAILPGEAIRRWGDREYPENEIMTLVGANDSIRADLGWFPAKNLESGLEETIAWQDKYKSIYESLPSCPASSRQQPSPATAQDAVELSVLCPVYNEEENVPRVYESITRILGGEGIPFELIFSDNRSEDRSWELVTKLAERDGRVRGIRLSKNFGYQSSITNAMTHASGKAVVIIDADLQDPPELILTFYRKWKLEKCDVVYGVRAKRKDEPLWRKGMMKVFYRFLNAISEIPIPVDAGDFRLMDRRVVDVVNAMGERDRYLRGMVSWAGFKQLGIPYVREGRKFGESKFPLSKAVALALDGIVGFSMKPLRLGLYTSVGLLFAGFLLVCYAI